MWLQADLWRLEQVAVNLPVDASGYTERAGRPNLPRSGSVRRRTETSPP